MAKRYSWSRNSDDEIWRGGPCDSIRECVKEASDEGYRPDETIAIGLIEDYEVNYDFAQDIIEHLAEDAYEEVGEASDGWLDSTKKEDLDRLNDRLIPIIKEWLKEIHEEPCFYKVLPFEECTLQEALEIHWTKVADAAKGGKIK